MAPAAHTRRPGSLLGTFALVLYATKRGPMRGERDRAPRNSTRAIPKVARSPLRAHRASALWCTRAVGPYAPFSVPHLRVARGPYRVDPDVVINSRLHSAERPLAAVKSKLMERHLFMSVQTLEKCVQDCKRNTAKKPEGPIGFEAWRRRPYVRFVIYVIGSANHGLAPSRQSFAVDGRDCKEQTHILFTSQTDVISLFCLPIVGEPAVLSTAISGSSRRDDSIGEDRQASYSAQSLLSL